MNNAYTYNHIHQTSTINREIRKTMIAVLAVEVTTNITHINSQQTRPLKMAKKNGLHQLKLQKRKREKSNHFFCKIRPYKQRQEERFETIEVRNYGESETNNNEEQNEHTIIVPDTQDVPNNQVEENVSNSVRDNFFLHGQGATKANQRKN